MNVVVQLRHGMSAAEDKIFVDACKLLAEHLLQSCWIDNLDEEYVGPTIPLHDALDNCGQAITDFCLPILYDNYEFFGEWRKRLFENEARMNGLSMRERRRKAVPAPQERDEDPSELCYLYFRDTPLLELFNVYVPFRIPNEIQFAHTWVVAGSGHGKTTLLTSMLCDHIPEVLAGRASIVLIDSQNVIIPQLERLKAWEGSDRLIVVDPTEPIAFSLFDAPRSELNSALEMINFVFAKVADNDLTYRQSNLFNYLSEFLITAVPDATLDDFRNMLDLKRAPAYDQYKVSASEEVQDYLETDFVKEKFTVEARNQVLTKLRAMLREPAFAQMFNAPRTRLDLFAELERGVCCLIKPTKAALGEDGTKLFGRFWIAQMKLVAQKRQYSTKKTPTFFYIDECQDYLRGGDPKIETILEQARKENIGVTLLHHYADQLKSTELIQLLGANTATKICGSLASADLSRFASYLECKPSFITAQQPRKTFACSVRGMTKQPISLRFPFINLKDEPLMSEQAYRQIRADNIRKYGALETIPKQRGDTVMPVSPSRPAYASTGVDQTSGTVPQNPENARNASSELDMIVSAAATIETLLTTKLGATGRGLHEKVQSVEELLPPYLVRPAYFVAEMRNKKLHQAGFTLHKPDKFLAAAKLLEDHLKGNEGDINFEHIKPVRE